MARPSTDWRDVAATPGTWRLSESPSGAAADFAGGLLSIRCDRAAGAIWLIRADGRAIAAGEPTTVSARITTSDSARTLSANRIAGAAQIRLPARDALYDAMAFSRGRFMIEVDGTQTLYVPSWTEISRVVEDCR